MENKKVVAVLSRSSGNESVGDMWLETKVFLANTPVGDIVEWACKASGSLSPDFEHFRGNLRITIAQSGGQDAS